MPKGEYDTPGPFHLTSPNFIHRDGRPCLVVGAQFDEAEVDELVGLLNKGTHFERMRDALGEIVGAAVEPEDEPSRVLVWIGDRASDAMELEDGDAKT